MPAAALLLPSRDNLSSYLSGNGSDVIADMGLNLVRTIPETTATTAPDDVPPAVARVFIQAKEAETRGYMDVAAMGYRKALDIALGLYDPQIKGTFQKRIDALAERHDLTPALREWAHEVRLIGNEGAHEADEPTTQEVEDMAAFTTSVLEYLFTLPERVTRRRRVAGSHPSE
jgi:hypothetical protein